MSKTENLTPSRTPEYGEPDATRLIMVKRRYKEVYRTVSIRGCHLRGLDGALLKASCNVGRTSRVHHVRLREPSKRDEALQGSQAANQGLQHVVKSCHRVTAEQHELDAPARLLYTEYSRDCMASFQESKRE